MLKTSRNKLYIIKRHDREIKTKKRYDFKSEPVSACLSNILFVIDSKNVEHRKVWFTIWPYEFICLKNTATCGIIL